MSRPRKLLPAQQLSPRAQTTDLFQGSAKDFLNRVSPCMGRFFREILFCGYPRAVN